MGPHQNQQHPSDQHLVEGRLRMEFGQGRVILGFPSMGYQGPRDLGNRAARHFDNGPHKEGQRINTGGGEAGEPGQHQAVNALGNHNAGSSDNHPKGITDHQGPQGSANPDAGWIQVQNPHQVEVPGQEDHQGGVGPANTPQKGIPAQVTVTKGKGQNRQTGP